MTAKTASPIRQAALFFVLAFAISWIIWFSTALLPGSTTREPFILLGGFGPFLAAVAVIFKTEGRKSVKHWFRQVFRFRISWAWYLVGALVFPFAMAFLHHGLYIAMGGRSGFSLDQQWGLYFAYLFPTALLGGGNEEPGWRGFATPRLLTLYHPVSANVLVGLLWMAWHLPLYLISGWSGTDQPILWFALYAIGLSIVMTWLYFKSSQSIFPVMLLHAGTNAVFGFFPRESEVFGSMDLDFNIIKTITYWLVALVIIITTKGQLGYPKGMGPAALSS